MGYSPWSHKEVDMAEHTHTCPGLTAEEVGIRGSLQKVSRPLESTTLLFMMRKALSSLPAPLKNRSRERGRA